MKEKRNVVVVDTSLAIKWILTEADSPIAHALLAGWSRQDFILLAPDLLLYEITNGLYQKTRKDELTSENAVRALDKLMQLGLNFETTTNEKLSLQALHLAHIHKLPATYDAHYLALAEREDCVFWTADRRLYNAVGEKLPWVRLMASYDPTIEIF